VLAAMGVLTRGSLRVSLPRGTTPISRPRASAVSPGIVARLRGMVAPRSRYEDERLAA